MNEKEVGRIRPIEWGRVAHFYDNYAQATFDIPFFVFDLIIIPFHSFGELISSGDQKRVLARIYQHLVPGALYLYAS